MNKLIEISEAANMMGVSIETMRRWDRSGKLSSVRIGDVGRRRYDKDQIIKLIKNK